jgi:hypothetical protein
VEQLNQPPWRGSPVILTCRAAVYDSVRALRPGGADAGLHIATAVTVSKLSPPEICRALAAYLQADGLDPNDWAPLTRSLTAAPDGVLADALSTPWMLTLAVSRLRAVGSTAASELARCPDTAAVRDKLFAALIPAAVEARPRDKVAHYQPKRAHAWLARLARHLSSQREKGQGGTDIALHELWRMAGPRAPRYLHGLASWLAVGVAAGLAAGLGRGLMGGLMGGTEYRPLADASRVIHDDAVFGLMAGLMGGTEYRPLADASRVIHDDAVFGLMAGLMAGLVGVLAFGLAGGLGGGLLGKLVGGLVFGLVVGLVSAREEHRNGNWRQRRSCDGAGRKPDAAWRPTGPIARVAADAETSHLMRQRLQPGRIRSGPAFTLASVLVVGSGSGRDYRTTYSRILPRTCGRGSPTRMLRVGRRLAISASFRGAVTGAST